ncbi:MAG: IclR family transcriptional regulator [Thermoleophilia bacterium]
MSGVRSVERAVAILETFPPKGEVLTLTEIARLSGLSKTTAHRLLGTLTELGMVEFDPRAQGYRLGLKVFRLGSIVRNSIELVQEAEPILHRLVQETEETAFLIVPDGVETLCLERIDGLHSVRVLFLETGRRLPYNAGAGPRVLLAHLPEQDWKRTVSEHVRRMTPNSLVTMDQLAADREAIRRNGYSLSREDVSAHAAAVGAPVRDHSGRVVAAVSIAGIVQRFSDENLPFLVEAVRGAGRELSLRMGWEAEPRRRSVAAGV